MSLAGRSSQGRRMPGWLASLAVVGSYATIAGLGRPAPPAAAKRIKPRRGWAAWKHILFRTYEEINNDRLLALAAGVVFYGLLALFPAVTALVSSYALFAKASTINAHLALISSVMPASAYQIVDEQVTRIVMRGTGDLGTAFFIGLALAVWSANAGVKAVIDALNICYGVKERRGFFRLNAVSLLFTVGAIATLLLAIAAVIVLPLMMSFLHAGRYGELAVTWLRWPAMLLVVLFGLATLYRFGPDV